MAKTKQALSVSQQLAAEVNKAIGSDVVLLGNDPKFVVERMATGIRPFDYLMDGGLPRNRFVMIYGDESTLKSYLGYRAIGRVQEDGGTCALVDTEHSFDPEWAASAGVRVDDLVLLHPESGELAVDATEAMVRSGVDLVVWDSVAATLPQAEREKRLHGENVQPARIAALMSVASRRLTAANTRTCVLWINQTRLNVGVTFGNPETVPGGKALKFYAGVILSMRKAGKIKEPVRVFDGTEYKNKTLVVGEKIMVTIEKSKLSVPHRSVYIDWNLRDKVVDETGFLIALGLEQGIIMVEGQMWKLKGLRETIRGRDAFRDWLEAKPSRLDRLAQSLS